MAIRVDTNGDGIWDLELNDPTVSLPSIFDIPDAPPSDPNVPEDADSILDVVITAAGSSAVIDGVIFRAVTATNAGTGIYNTFLAIGDNDGNEAGFNSADTPPLDDTNEDIDHAKTETVLLANIPITVIDGVEYYEVRIDINDSDNQPNALISLDTFQIYTSTDGSIVSTTQLFSQNKVFDIDENGGGNISIMLSDAQSAGSGNDDYSILIPVSKFGDADPATTYFYLYARMGFAGGDFVAGATFEEFNLQNAVTLTGTKFNDRDGDGVRDAGEEGLGGVTIFIDTDLDGVLDFGERSTVTKNDGSYTFYGIAAGTYRIDEVVPAGSTQTTGAFETITITENQAKTHGIYDIDAIGNFNPIDISGTKFLDDEGDGQATGDAGMGGVTIFIDMDNSGTFNAGDLSTVTAANGTWSFTNLGSNVIGKTVNEVLPNGYVQTLGTLGYTITGTSGTDQTGLNFANFELFDVSGTKYADLDGDGVIDPGEVGMGGVTIFIDMDGDATLDAGELTTTTAADGSWSFTDLGVGFAGKKVYEVLPSGFVQTLGTAGYAITGTSGTDQTGLNFANFDPNPVIDLEKFVITDQSGGELDADDPDGPIASTSTTVNFHVSLANTGNVALTNITLTDSVVHTINGIAGAPQAIDYYNPIYDAWVDLDGDTVRDANEGWATADGDGDGVLEGVVLDVGETLNIYYSLTSALGQHENTASVTATAVLGGESTDDADDANYYVLPTVDCVGVGTPGFWKNNGLTYWDNIDGNEKNAGKPGWADGELIYAVDSNNDGVINGSDAVGLLVGDFNHNGLTDAGENTLFISLADARTLIDASQKQQQDGKYMLGRDVVATWLNFLANGGSDGDTSCIDRPGTADDGFNPQHYLTDAINWLQTYAGAGGNGNASDLGDNVRNESFDVFSLLATAVKTNSSYWQAAVTNVADHSAANMHSALDAYNNTGVINGVEFCCDRDNSDAMFALAQIGTP